MRGAIVGAVVGALRAGRSRSVAFLLAPPGPRAHGGSDVSFGTAEVERLESRARERLGVTLQGKYTLDRVLGLGGMATVYAATHRNGKEVALKLLHPEYAEHSEVRERFLREGYVANRVRHPGAVSVIDDDVTSGGDAFLVMELLEGSTVEEFWEQREHRVHPAWVTAILLQVLDVIAAAHEQGIIHRDLKPANLFLTRDGAVKVLDFGIARLRAPGAHTTNVGSLLGTPAYMAPEQAMGRSALVDETTDLWAIAAIAFALLSGDVVHPGESMQQTLIFAATRPAPPLGPLAPGAPTGIGPTLAGYGSAAWLRGLVRDPGGKEYYGIQNKMAAAGRELSGAELDDLVAYLLSLELDTAAKAPAR